MHVDRDLQIGRAAGMRLISLRVKNFCRIREAKLSFEPGINVFYGPNELGKSTLVDAIRAILLTPTTSTHASRWRSWSDVEAIPEVELQLESEERRTWRARKSFDRNGAASLDESSDGVSFEHFASQRNVDGELRKLLRWGLKAPGGKSGARGMPESFMTAIALPGQAEATKVFERTLEKDDNDSARDMLKQALEALSTDPVLSHAIQCSQKQVDVAFTPTGRPKKTKGSPLVIAKERSAQLKDDLEALQKKRENTQHLREMMADLQQKLKQLQTEREHLIQHCEVATAYEEAKKAFDEQDAKKLAWEERCATHADLEAALADAKRQLQQAEENQLAAAAQHKTAQSELEATKAEHSEQTQMRRKAEAEKGLAQAINACERLERQLKLAQQRDKATQHLEQARQGEKEILKRLDASQKQTHQAEVEVQVIETQRVLTGILTAQQRIRDADKLLEQREQAAAALTSIETELEKLSEQQANTTLPTAEQWETIQKVDRQLQIAKEKMAVGLSVELDLDQPRDVELQADDKSSEVRAMDGTDTFSAQRKVVISVPGVGSFIVKAGSPQDQQHLDELQARWDQDVKPWLERGTAATIADLAETIEAGRQRDAQARDLQRDLDAKSALLVQSEATASSLQTVKDEQQQHQQQWQAIAESIRVQAEQRHSSHPQTQAELEAMLGQARQAVHDRKQESADQNAELGLARQTIETCEKLLSETDSDDEDRLESPQEYESELANSKKVQQKLEAEVQRLSSGQAPEIAAATEALSVAEAELKKSEAALSQCRRQHSEVLSNVHKSEGELKLLEGAFDSQQHSRTEAALRKASDARKKFGDEVTLDDLRRQSNEMDVQLSDTRDQLRDVETELNSKGGEGLEEQIADLADALRQSEAEEVELHREFEAWKLLNESLKAVEQGEASNLGNAISPALDDLVTELSGGTHSHVELGGEMDLRHFRSNGQEHSLTDLSMGMQDQFATLLRVHLASQLEQFIVLDDQLVQSDPERMVWLRKFLQTRAEHCQINVFTCHPDDYCFDADCNIVDLTEVIQGFDD